MRASPQRSASDTKAAINRRTDACSEVDRRRRNSRRSSETCSFRDRPVCSRRPGIADALHQLPFDKGVHVLVGTGDPRRVGLAFGENLGERRRRGRRVVGRQDAGRLQGLRPREAADHVVFKQSAIETKRRAEVEDRGVGLAVEAAGPERGHGELRSLNGLQTFSLRASDAVVRRRRRRARSTGGADAGGPTTRHAPRNSSRRTAPERRSAEAAVNASRAARAGVCHRPSSISAP